MDPIIILDGRELRNFLENLATTDVRKLSVHVDGEHVKFKINEHMWSPPMGKKREND